MTGGFNVTPTQVEEVIRRHPDVADVSVVGIPDTRGGETVAAAVVPRDGGRVDEAALSTFARESLAAYKVPRTWVEVGELPRSLIGKTLRARVRDMILEGRD